MADVFDASKITNHDDYAMALIIGIMSVRSLELAQKTAFTAGLLDETEAQISTTICWELRRLMSLYTNQLDYLREHTDVNIETITAAIGRMYGTTQAEN